MQKQRSRDTGIELALRSELHRRGHRFRVHCRLIAKSRREVDIVLPRHRLAVFVDGCFWHACPDHASWPKHNAEFWRAKIEGNTLRDRQTDSELVAAGWKVLRVWEHTAACDAADIVETHMTAGTRRT